MLKNIAQGLLKDRKTQTVLTRIENVDREKILAS